MLLEIESMTLARIDALVLERPIEVAVGHPGVIDVMDTAGENECQYVEWIEVGP